MKSRVVSLVSAKGGSGKTVLTATFAAFLSTIGKKILMIDADAATNGLTLMYLDEVVARRETTSPRGRRARGLLDVGEGDHGHTTIKLHSGHFFLPVSYGLSSAELTDEALFEARLQAVVAWARGKYDYIFIDTQPGSELQSIAAMKPETADEIVIVSEFDPISAAGVERLKAVHPGLLSYERTWVLLNKMLPEFVGSYNEFLKVARYLSPIAWDASVVLAYSKRQLALDMGHGNSYTLSVTATLRTLLGDNIEPSLEAWVSQQRATLLQPIERKIAALHDELAELPQRRMRVAIGIMTMAVAGSGAFVGIGFALLTLVPGHTTLLWISVLIVAILTTIASALTLQSSRLRRITATYSASRTKSLVSELERLESLRDADLPTLIKRRGSSAGQARDQ
jgi:cellulose biosynthesis protein BcsQ